LARRELPLPPLIPGIDALLQQRKMFVVSHRLLAAVYAAAGEMEYLFAKSRNARARPSGGVASRGPLALVPVRTAVPHFGGLQLEVRCAEAMPRNLAADRAVAGLGRIS
jgi:hypothetical protein